MNPEQATTQSLTTRREFLKTSGAAVAATALAGTLAAPRPGYTAEDNTIKIALVGCGGRGTGAAANALSTKGPTQLWAMADVFEHRLEGSFKALSPKYTSQIHVPPERRFLGFDSFKRAIDALDKGDLVLLATPAAFRPIHFEYAVQKGVNVFMEKSFATDAPGIRRILRAAELAKQKNLKVATGLMWRHDKPREEVIQRIHDGAIGDLLLLRTYRMHGPVGFKPKGPDETELGHQILNYSCFTWLNASFFVDWLIHNIDVCCWAKNAWPVTAQGHGARAAREDPDQMFDQYMIEYTFADGAKLLAEGRHNTGCWDIYSDFAHGTKGSALIMESLAAAKPRLYKNQVQTRENEFWRYSGGPCEPYQVEHDLLFDAIRNDKPYNEAERGARACFVSIMGRMAAESGKLISYDEALASKLEQSPGLDLISSLAAPAPVQPDANGRYPIPVPGRTVVL
ncbi:MAG: Gfo/Idh/MocA family oxidoreductase [Verrucomicrobia bacterium]|nr:Gfo/Idh/MocA family oxidoreductase [Verrucomicrobiota bacterium]